MRNGELQDAEFVKQAIDSAREYAEKKGVAMTLERLAVCLGVEKKQIMEIVNAGEIRQKSQKEIQRLLKMAYEEVAASQIEHGMVRGNHSTMDVFLLKSNHNYKDKNEQEANFEQVVFLGEDNLPE